MRPKKIYIEGLALVEGHFSGIGQYTLGILQGFDDVLEVSLLAGKPVPEICVIIPHDTVERFRSFGFKHISYKTVPFSFRVMSGLWHRQKMPPLDLFCGPGLYIFTRFVNMPLLFSKSFTIVYDLSFELAKEYSDDRNARFLSKGVRQSITKSKRVITISKSVKKELVEFYDYDSSKVIVAYPAVDRKYFYHRNQAEIDQVKQKYKIEGNYILALSNLEPRKNLDGLVDAYCNLPKSITKDLGLLLVGVNGWKTEKLFDKIVAKVLQGANIMRPSRYITDEDKPAIISGAKMLVYPSHYEGFGIPPLEALACGVPVITSDNSSLPEVVKGAATMVKSTDTPALTKAIKSYLDDWKQTAGQARTAGPERAVEFSWADSAQIILAAATEEYS